MYAASSEMVAPLGIWWVSLQSADTSKKSQLSPNLRACSTTAFTHTALTTEFDSEHLVSTTFEAPSIKKTIDGPYSLLFRMSSYLYTNTKAVCCWWRRTIRKGLVHFSSQTKPRVSPSLSWPLAKLNTFPGLPKSLVPVWPAKDQNRVRGAAACISTILSCPRQGQALQHK